MGSKRKLIIVTQTFPPRVGGMQKVMASLAEGLAQREEFVAPLLVLTDHKAPQNPHYKTRHFPLPKLLRPFAKRLFLSLTASKETLYLCDSWKSVKAIPSSHKNIVIMAHGQEYLRDTPKLYHALKRAKYIIPSSNTTKGLVLKFGVSDDKMKRIYPLYDMKKQEISSQSPSQKRSKLYFITASRLEARKGLLPCLYAFAKLKEHLPPWHWDIIGKGPQMALLQETSERLHLQDNVTFHGFLPNEERDALLRQGDVFLMPSYQEGNSLEGFGISYIEAAQYGVPAIAGKEGGAVEAVLDGKTGWNVDIHDEKQLCAILQEAVMDSQKRKQYGKAAQHYFENTLISPPPLEQVAAILHAIE